MGVEFVNINVDTTGLYPTKTIDYGTVAVVGQGGTSTGDPIKVGTYAEADTTYGDTDLGTGIKKAILNGATNVWAVEVGDVLDIAALDTALDKIVDYDVQAVALANTIETSTDVYVSDCLLSHVNGALTDRIGVFMLDKGEDIFTVPSAITDMVGSGENRMFGVAHNSDDDVACAVAGLLVSLQPWQSPILKSIQGVAQSSGFTTTQLSAFDTNQINPLVSPVYLGGKSYVLSTDYTCGDSSSGIHRVDVRRTIDDVSYKIKAGITSPNIIGNLRINTTGLAELGGRISGILQGAQNLGEIDSFKISIPVLNALSKNESSRSDAEDTLITNARTSRAVDVDVVIEYSGSIHTINMDLKFTA